MQPHSPSVIGKSAFWSVSNQLIGQILSLLVFLITARFVSKEDFGVMATCMLAVELFRQFLIESIGTTIYAKKFPTDDDYNAAFFIIAACGTVSAMVVFFLAQPIADIFGHHAIAPSLRWISAILLTMGLSKMQEIWLTKHLQFKSLALRSIGSILVGGGVGVAMAVHGLGIASLIAQQIVTALASLAWLWFASPWRPSWKVRRDNVVSILHDWKFLALNSLIALVSGQSDVLFCSYYLGPAATGVYNAAKRLLAAVGMVFNGGLNSVALPALTSYAHEEDRFQKSFLMSLLASTFITAPVYIGLAVLSGDIIDVLMGQKWAAAAPVLTLLAISAFMSSVNLYSTNILLIQGKVKWQVALGLISAITMVLLLWIFARYGLEALASALIVRIAFTSIIVIGISLYLMKLPTVAYLRQVACPVGFSLVMAGLITYAKTLFVLPPLLSLIVYVPFGALVYFMLFFVFDRKTLLTGLGLVKGMLPRKNI